jgi:hypothetical protein
MAITLGKRQRLLNAIGSLISLNWILHHISNEENYCVFQLAKHFDTESINESTTELNNASS